MNHDNNTLRQLFQLPFNIQRWTTMLRDYFHASEIKAEPERINDTSDEEAGYYLGAMETSDSYRLGFFLFNISNGDIMRKRVGLRRLVKSFVNPNWGEFDAALVVFNDSNHWRLSLICDIKEEATAPKRYTYVLGDVQNYYNTPVSRFIELQDRGITFANIREAFSVEALSKDFYNDLYAWYQWALSDEVNVTFPNNPNDVSDDRENLNIKLIRLITRLLFVWFIKQKKLVPESLFDVNKLSEILKDFNKTSKEDGNYYNAILQNLFFATLNCAIIDEEGKPRRFADASRRDTRNLYRYLEMFSISEQQVVQLFAGVPFLNGGLFECLDKPKDLYINLDHDILFDGFSRNGTRSANGNLKYRAFIPNILFFNDNEEHPGLISLLNRYNFTIEENSPTDAVVSLDPELLGRVFENLLAAYNPETQESARKSTGSFYTPRIIVDYMVDESLKSYIINKKIGGVTREMLDNLFDGKEYATSFFTSYQRENIITALKQIKILDPACGSGAFPMGCLLSIVEIVERLSDTTIDRYALKLSIIENCVFGVDIQSIAMMICKLRFFISLICEQENIDFNSPETNFGINTLPNLETKFVAANSLISADIRNYDGDWTRDEHLVELKEKLLQIRNAHLLAKGRRAKHDSQRNDEKMRKDILSYILDNTSNPDPQKIANYEKQITQLSEEAKKYAEEVWVDETCPVQVDLFGVVENGSSTIFHRDINKEKRDDIKQKQNVLRQSIAKEKAKGEITGFEAAVKQLTEWDPYDQNTVSSFFDPEWMFCIEEKFDIVIGNPPYIQLQNNGGELAKLYEPCGYKTFNRKGDIYCLFYERGQQLLKRGGHLCYITSNKWMRAAYGEKTREFFATQTDPQLLIDFAGVKVFESATVDTNILLFAKADNQHNTLCAVTNKQDKDSVKNLSVFVRQNGSACEFSSSDSWVILSPIEQSIKRKIEAVGTPLKDWDIQINYGIKTGCNEAFIIDTAKREEILANCQTEEERKRTAELIRPILRGRDIKRYGYEWAGLYLIATFPSRHYDIDQYPAVKQYLLSFGIERLEQTGKTHVINGEKVKARKKTNNKWFETQDSISYWEDFSKPKIVFQEIVQDSQFFLDNTGTYFCNDTCRIVIGEHLTFLLGILNSRLFFYSVKHFYGGGVLGEGGVRMKHTFFQYFPCIPSNNDINNAIQSMIKEQSPSTSQEIDKLIYKAYNLTSQEIEDIESDY